ncbi:MAG: hypothetical protein E5Y67_25370 [Mesorhizobium sp.]|uniref:helix-turn-helix domain-containing protein n=1 Tax=Mesorhizobium sp. TaxID=1871066 RepID=UPI0011F55137|nr:helix-turn-helix domain-containing protein [Mesorhizobium sp.]TIM10974.1 MAG: hypothetical protein E5Y67_25370 [Mesorhizobium sp.]
MNAVALTLAEVTKLTGAKRRTVQLWAEAGVLIAEHATDRAGTGVHRRFSKDEAIVACLVHAFARRLQTPIGVLLRISKLLRTSMSHEKFASMVHRAIADPDSELFLILRGSGAPSFVIEFGDGSVDEELSLAVVEGKTAGADRDALIAKNMTAKLNSYGSVAVVICANPYLSMFQ